MKLTLDGMMISSHDFMMFGGSQVETVRDMGGRLGTWGFRLISLKFESSGMMSFLAADLLPFNIL